MVWGELIVINCEEDDKGQREQKASTSEKKRVAGNEACNEGSRAKH